jgi:hypothetical protein
MIAKKNNVYVKNDTLLSSHSLQGFRPPDLFWFHYQLRSLLMGRPWLRFPQVDIS